MGLASPAASRSPAPIHIDAKISYMRTLTVDDASARWASWFDQADVQEALNLPPRRNTKADIIAYIRKHDQDTRILLGIFDRADDMLVGILSLFVDWQKSTFAANTIVGEADRRHKGFMMDVTPPFRDYFFETRGLNMMVATALATNKAIRAYLEKTGWTLDQTLPAHVRSHADGRMLDLCCYSITRDAWRAWKATNLA